MWLSEGRRKSPKRWNNEVKAAVRRKEVLAEVTAMEELKFEVKVGKLKYGKAIGEDEITGEMINVEAGRVVDWIWRLYNMAIE